MPNCLPRNKFRAILKVEKIKKIKNKNKKYDYPYHNCTFFVSLNGLSCHEIWIKSKGHCTLGVQSFRTTCIFDIKSIILKLFLRKNSYIWHWLVRLILYTNCHNDPHVSFRTLIEKSGMVQQNHQDWTLHRRIGTCGECLLRRETQKDLNKSSIPKHTKMACSYLWRFQKQRMYSCNYDLLYSTARRSVIMT